MTVSADGVKMSDDNKLLEMDNSTAYRLVLNIITTMAFEAPNEKVIDEEDERPAWPGE